jgi:uncharacterized membrane protein YedE/YeeE
MSVLANLLIGLLFGCGLVISGMTDPAKVLNFLDVTGTWDPSLAFVMGGAVVVAAIGFRLTLARQRPLLAPRFELVDRTRVDGRLLGGAALFGIGWGLVGFCPGPAFAALSTGTLGPAVFVVAMLAGMLAGRRLDGAAATGDAPAAARA